MPSETIYVPLLDEGTPVWRPVLAEPIRDGVFRITSEMPDDEQWAYKPGQKVIVMHHVFSDGKSRLVANGLVNEDASISSTLVELAPDELRIICNALNEICNGVGLGDEFETRTGSTVDFARNLLARLSAVAGCPRSRF